jgi:CRP-like cAMP-binding protein
VSREPTPAPPQDNHLLAALSDDARQRIAPHLERVDLPLGKVLHEAGNAIKTVYFPIDSVVSHVHMVADGHSAEIALVGSEGLVGVSALLGGDGAIGRAIVQAAGQAWRMPASILVEEFNRHDELQRLVLRYLQMLLTQVAQTAVCNRHHTIDQQLCRWLLQSLDHVPGNRLSMTQELIASMLGVRREGVTDAARKLQALGVIEYTRGRINVLDRPRLEGLSCECYAIVRRGTDRLLHGYAAARAG